MIFRYLRYALLAALLVLPATASAQAPKASAYLGWWLPDGWRGVPLDRLERLLFFELKVNGKGDIAERNGWPERWTDLRGAVKRAGLPLDLTLTLFDAATFDTLFASTGATQHLLDEALALARHGDVAGLHIDFEIYSPVQPKILANYRRFVSELAKRLSQQTPGRKLSLFFPIGGDANLYDAATLALADRVVLQGYDSHWLTSKSAGPVAPLTGDDGVTWEKSVAQAVALGVPKHRLQLGFPLYGYEWQVKSAKLRGATIGDGVHTSFALLSAQLVPDMRISVQDRVRQHGASHDPASGSSFYQFKNANGQFIEGWFEDWWALARKQDYLAREKLGGIVFFVLGYDNAQLVDFYLRRSATMNQ